MPPQKVTALSSENAFILLHVKDLLPNKSLVNICGKVTAVSEIFEINKDFVFCIELQYGVPIIVKHSQYHGWQQQILPGKSIVLTFLRPTTLAKEYKPPQRVYVPWSGSCLLPKDPNIQELSLQDWLAHYGITPPQEATMVPPNFKEDIKLDSFQGVITDNSTRAYGVIVLDNTTRLFLTHLPKLKHHKSLEVGDIVTLYNVHQRICPQTKEKQLFCCVRSRICILQKETSETKREEQRVSLQSLLCDDSFTMSDTLALIHLHQNIVTTLSVRSQFNVKNVMRHLVYKVWNQGVERHRRNFLLEFCQPEAFCPFANDQDHIIPRLTQLGDLKQMASDNASVSDLHLETQRTDCEDLWTYSTRKFVEKNTKPFLGWLALNPVTGRLQLHSDKDKMNIVVLSSNSETPEATHQCSSSCHCDGLHPGQRMSCPFIHPCCLGHLLLVTKYLVVKEAFGDSSNHQSITTDHIHYLIISTCDCILVDKKHLSPPSCTAHKHASEDSTHSFAGHEKCLRSESRRKITEKYESSNSYLVYITSKESLLAKIDLTSEWRLQFFAEGILVNPNGEDPAHSKCVANGSLDPEIKQKQVIDLKNEVINLSSVKHAEHKTLSSKNISSSAALMASVSSGKGSFNTFSDFSANQPLVLAFRNRSCMWHDAIQPKGLYCFNMKYSRDEHALLWPQMDKKLQETLQNGAAVTEVKVSDEAEIDRIFKSSFTFEDASKQTRMLSIDLLMSDGNPGMLVSFIGIIIWRKHPQLSMHMSTAGTTNNYLRMVHPDTLNGCLQGRCLCVGVKDSGQGLSSARVYFNNTAVIYPLGLLPGMMVEFLRVDKRVSRSGNTYFQFLPVSSLCILSGPKQTAHNLPNKEANKEPVSWKDAQFQLLVSLWGDQKSQTIFMAQCQICRFFRISLKSRCGLCGAIMSTVSCTAPACTNSSHAILSSNMSILIEDGSCQALVSISKYGGVDVARRLLKLSQQEWFCLEKVVQKQGEVFIQNFDSPGGTAAEVFVSRLCNSFDVRRPCIMLLQKSMSSYKKAAGIDGLSQNDLVTRKINTGEFTVETLCLPYLQLECLDIQEV